MRILLILVAAVMLLNSFSACKSATAPKSFCDSVCLSDTLKFVKEDNPLKPFVYITARNCVADTLMWSYDNMESNHKIGFPSLVGNVSINKNFISCFIRDTSYAWLKFNDCSNGRGYLIKIPYSKGQKMSWKSSAINSYDPKFVIADGLIAYSDRGNLFAEEEATGKTAMMTFGSRVEIDYDHVHETLDSVTVTPTYMRARVKMNDEWKVIEKVVEFK